MTKQKTILATVKIIDPDRLYGTDRLVGRYDATGLSVHRAAGIAARLIKGLIPSDRTDASSGRPELRRQVMDVQIEQPRESASGQAIGFHGARLKLAERGSYGHEERLEAIMTLEELTPMLEATPEQDPEEVCA